MEEEAIITSVQPGTQRSPLGSGLEIEFAHVSFRVLRRSEYQDKVCKVILKSPGWLADAQPSAPLHGYLMERGEFAVELPKDERIKEGLRVTVEVTEQ
jgi:hypothetical protein